MMALNSIICGDVREELPNVPTGSVQAVIADPPYYNVLKEDWDTQWDQLADYLEWSRVWVSQCMRILREDGLCFIFGQLGKREHGFIHLMSQLCRSFQFHDLIIWDRVVGYNERRDSLTPAYEMILVLRKGEKVKFNKDKVRIPYDARTIEMYLKDTRYKDKKARLKHLSEGKFATNILSVPSLKGASKEKCGHPSQKPLELITKLILLSTDAGDVVLDPFLGSGTTAVAAEPLGRSWLGVEIRPEYCAIAQQRLANRRDLFAPGSCASSPATAQPSPVQLAANA
jgi:site-specific DNA-methyltransferase (adenine-specific)